MLIFCQSTRDIHYRQHSGRTLPEAPEVDSGSQPVGPSAQSRIHTWTPVTRGSIRLAHLKPDPLSQIAGGRKASIDRQLVEEKLNTTCPAMSFQEFIGSLEWENVDLERLHEISVEGGFKFTKEHGISDHGYNENCAICLTVIGQGEYAFMPIRMLPCRHIYHDGCIVNWLASEHSACAICMKEIPGF